MVVKTLRELALFGFYLAVAIVLTWPLAARITTTVSDLGDPLLNAWILDWNCYALTHQPLHLFDAPILYPAKYPLAFSEHLTGIAIVMLPFHLAGAGAIALHNIAMLFGFAFSAYGASVLARVVTHRFGASVLAGLLYGFVPYRFAQIPHLQVVSGGWLPLILAALLVYRRSPTIRNAALFAAAFVMNGLTNIYFLFFAAAATAITLVLIAIAERRDLRFWLRLAAALAISAAILLPFLLPYRAVSKIYDLKRGAGETMEGSANWGDWLTPPDVAAIYRNFVDPAQQHAERQLFPGAVMLFLALIAVLLTARAPAAPVRRPRRRLVALDAAIGVLALVTFVGIITREVHIAWHGKVLLDFGRSHVPAMLLAIAILVRCAIQFPAAIGDGNLRSAIANSRFPFEMWAAAVWVLVGFLGAFGMRTFFHAFLFHYAPGFRAIRAPGRWAMIAYVGLAIWAAWGAIAITSRRRWLMPLLFAAALIELRPLIHWEQALTAPAPVDLWLSQTKAGPLLELPINRLNVLYLYLLRATAHHVPIFDGISGFEPPLHRFLRERPIRAVPFEVLERNDCRYILVRPDWYGFQWPDGIQWLRRGLAGGRVVFVRRFDSSQGSDWLFAMPRVEKNWQRYRVPSDDPQLARLLDGKSTYNGATFGQLSQPRRDAEVEGSLTVAGWALSPRGIREVNVLIDYGRVRIPAGLFRRDDVTQLFPWYPQTPKPAFATRIPRRPHGVSQSTDLQIEIIDGAGVRTLLPDVPLTWR